MKYTFAVSSKQLLLFMLVMAIACTQSFAQDTTVVKNKWHYLLQPYAMFPSMKGTVGLGYLPDAEVNADAGDIFNNLQIGAMLYFEAHNDHWAITSDLLYMDLKQDIEGKRGIISGEADAKQFAWELAGLRTIRPWLDVGVGLRLNSLKSGLDLSVDTSFLGGGYKSESTTKTWVDPIIIGRVKIPAGKKWLFQFRADMGGFGIGSNFAWQMQGDVTHRFSKLFGLGLGYRTISMDYETGDDKDRFLYDMNIFGPMLKFGFNF
jgi:hypothetical protein